MSTNVSVLTAERIQPAASTSAWLSGQFDILSVLPGAIYTTDQEGRITFYNEAAAKLWGIRPRLGENEWCGSWRLYWPDGRPMPHDQCPMAIALKENRSILGAEAVAERPDGTRVRFLAYPTPLRDETGILRGAINMLVDVTAHGQAELIAGRLAAIVESSDDAIISKDLEGTITTWNSGAQQLFGYSAEEIIGKSVMALIPADRHDEEPEILKRIRRGERVDHYETVRLRKDGSMVDISLTVSPIRDSSGTVIGASKIARDITERKRAQAQQDLLIGEMSHRIKNLFSVTNSLVALSARLSRTPTEMAEGLQGRLGALARAHGLTRSGLVETSETEHVTLHGLVAVIFAPYFGTGGPERLTVSGCDFAIRSSAITSLSLVLHEMATNAVKHGALSSPQGCIFITCSMEEGILQLQWEEHGGPRLNGEPGKVGFGTTLAQNAVVTQFGGELTRDWNAEGLIARLRLSLDRITAE